jgi:hypothetical protein
MEMKVRPFTQDFALIELHGSLRQELASAVAESTPSSHVGESKLRALFCYPCPVERVHTVDFEP